MTPLLPGLAATSRASISPRSRRARVTSIAEVSRRRSGGADGQERAEFADVLRAAQSGLPWARERLYSAYVADIAAYARGHGVPDPAALANDTMLGVLRRIERFRGNEKQFETWIYTVVRNALPVGCRPRRSRRQRAAKLQVERPVDLGVRDAALLLRALPAELRDVVLLRGVGDLETDQIAEIVGVPMAKAHVLRRRAAVAMLQLLDDRMASSRATGLASVQQRVSAAGLMGEVPRPNAELRALFGAPEPVAADEPVVADDGGRFARRVASLGAATVATALVSLTIGGPLGVLPVSRVSAATIAQHDATHLTSRH